MTNSKNRVSL
ncbi:hypothetical protein CP061683_1408A, partial [Chlamydia psittaci 06-1683]